MKEGNVDQWGERASESFSPADGKRRERDAVSPDLRDQRHAITQMAQAVTAVSRSCWQSDREFMGVSDLVEASSCRGYWLEKKNPRYEKPRITFTGRLNAGWRLPGIRRFRRRWMPGESMREETEFSRHNQDNREYEKLGWRLARDHLSGKYRQIALSRRGRQ